MTAIYLTEPQSYLEADLRDFAIVYNDRIQSRHSIDTTQQIIAFEGCTLGRSAIAAIYRYRIRLSFIRDNGHITAQITPQETPFYTVLQQERNSDRNFRIAFIHSLLRGRWYNATKVLQSLGYSGIRECLEQQLEVLPGLNSWLALQTWQVQVFQRYQKALRSVLVSVKDFEPTLELAYALLSRELYVLLLSSGCCAEVGTLHLHCQNHLPLPCDLMEPFRPVVEAWVFKKAPKFSDRGGLSQSHRATFVQNWESLMATQIFHAYAGQVSLRSALAWQVEEYVRAITETLEYRPFLLKS
ncbi:MULTISPECIES: CRISPR-associated endonuclease Cas1 [Limnospira]|uniref:CRISPR-associated endonuclease Cas1 n=1 Tax=Limnospira fusiformis PMC 851.14 TaxID=2219512 RepID=A0ABU9EFC0_LIMFS|nr:MULTISPECIES: CRISPR-associated endonuclease Cas1 [unclassified Limnospira]MDT9186752.1 CRISPR-associated endonuclease Cas1 [Limnospira sp. PMC 894.15]MDT9233331.1 CRISPR-associated endonuclease Cas1 [Limnospira sp. PMC 917.15]QJB27350.1 CRISPR-associated endonuclease Cas1 [Limnospira fusiformis SAG 85.79]